VSAGLTTPMGPLFKTCVWCYVIQRQAWRLEWRAAVKGFLAASHRVVPSARCPGTARSTVPRRRAPAGLANWTLLGVAPFQPGMPRFRFGPGLCAFGPDALRRTGVPTRRSAGWSSPGPRLPAGSRCTLLATAAGDSAAPRPGESFEAYHPSSIGVICVMIPWRLLAVKPFF
jgi:hypothetical protein